jgi:hypothetical protein
MPAWSSYPSSQLLTVQFRMHTSTRTKILLHVPSVPVIEHSASLAFGHYPQTLGLEAVRDHLAGFRACS